MAIVKATYTKEKEGAKANIRYITSRKGKDGEKVSRILFSIDGPLSKLQAYDMIDSAEEGSHFFRIVISPDPDVEDSKRDLYLQQMTQQTMYALSEHLETSVFWVAAEHNDHVPHRHIHILAVLQRKLQLQEIQLLRETATESCIQQRYERDRLQAQSIQQERGEGWEL